MQAAARRIGVTVAELEAMCDQADQDLCDAETDSIRDDF